MSERLLHSLREAVLTLLGMLGTLACTSMFEPGAAAAILGAVLSLSLVRSHLSGARHGAREALLALPLIALASVRVGELFRHAPWGGARSCHCGMPYSLGHLVTRIDRLHEYRSSMIQAAVTDRFDMGAFRAAA